MLLKAREEKFKLIGGQPSLDFANTVGGREKRAKGSGELDYQAEVRGERLEEYADLLAWSRKSGLLKENEVRILRRMAEDNPKAAAGVLLRAIRLREVIYRLFKAAIENWQPEPADVYRLNEELRLARKHERLIHDKNGFRFEWENGEVALDKMLWLLAQSATDILTSHKLVRVRQCDGENCGWVFLDTSRSGNRTWCDMRDCGNLAKVHRYRRKKSKGH
jgi:predicted RNA-binding Zn ribbon-like protein